MLECTHRNNEQVSYQLFLYCSQPSAAVGLGPVFLCRVLLELSKTGNVLSREASDSASALSSWCDFPRGSSFLFVTALWYLGGPLRKDIVWRWKKCISPRHCFQKSHQTKNVEKVSIFPCLLCPCVIVHLLQKAVVLKMEMLFGQKKRKKMLIFCSLALLVKIKLCGGNLCDSFFFFLLPCTPSFPPALWQ